MAVAKKLVDSFKAKSWYKLMAPKFLSEKEIGQVPALDDEHIINRIIIVPLKDITNDIGHMYYAVKLRVFEVKGKTAYTKFIGHQVSREYLRTLVRRRRDVINLVFTVKAADTSELRVKVVVVTNNLCSDSLKTDMRHIVIESLTARAKTTELGDIVHDIVYGKIAMELTGVLRKRASIRRVEISKTTLKEDFDTEDVVALPGKESEQAPKVITGDETAVEQAAAEPKEEKTEEEPATA
jgi:small subunit ribosomal protein S3Ae